MSGVLSGRGMLSGQGALAGYGAIARPPMSVLFFGNSFTYGEDAQPNWISVPDALRALASAAGKRMTTGMLAGPGRSWHWHMNDVLATTTALLQERPWTYVVLQNKVSESSHIGWQPDFHTWGEAFYDLIQTHCPSAKVRLFEGWAYGAGNSKMTGVSDATHFIDPKEMLDEISANYVTLRGTLNTAHPTQPPVEIVPVGQFKRSIGSNLPLAHPDYSGFWAPNQPTDDYIHGDRPWYFAAACCFFVEIYGVDPTPYAVQAATALGIDMTGYDAEDIATRAWRFVTDGAYPIVVLEDPEDASITEGGTGNFSVGAMGDPIAYQWRKDGVNVPGANAATFNYLSEVGEGGTAPEIDCVLSNEFGSKTTPAATLTIDEEEPEGPYATGGTVTEVGGYRIHTFAANDNIVFERGGEVERLIVGGGAAGAGASGGSNSGGGGGGGGVRHGFVSVVAGSYPIVIGGGGTPGTNAPSNGGAGGNSSFNGDTALGGGGGGERFTNGQAGGCGGGAGALATTGGAGTAGQGFAGGNTANGQAGGGGGAGEAGDAGLAAASPFVEGCSGSAGGDGYLCSISGSPTYYGGGGGGGTSAAGGSGRSSFGGAGGGGKGSNGNGPTTVPQAGTNGFGGGGGGAHQGSNQAGGGGGSGTVIIRYPI